MVDRPQTTAQSGPIIPILEQKVIMAARALTRSAAEFPDTPSIWGEWMDCLHEAVTALDRHLDEAWERRMA